VLFSKFKEFAEDVYLKMETFKRGVANQLGIVANTGIASTECLVPFFPIPGLVGAKATLLAAQTQILATDIDFRPKIDPCRSRWVFVNKENQ
jgi:hypothetical protein